MINQFSRLLNEWILDAIRLKIREIKKKRKTDHIRKIIHNGFKEYADHLYVSDNDKIIQHMKISARNLKSLGYRIYCDLNMPGPNILELQMHDRSFVTATGPSNNNTPVLTRTVGDLVKYLDRVT